VEKVFTEFIAKARYPVVFLVLGVLVGLWAAAGTLKIYGIEFTPYGPAAHVALGLLGLALIGFGVFLVLRDGGASRTAIKPKYDVFLAAPMASVDAAEYHSIRELCLDVLALMRAHCGVTSAYFVGEKLETQARFETNDVAAELDFDAIAASRHFVLIYPRKTVSSVLAEVGFALARGIPMTLFAATVEDLPYLLKQAGELPRDRFPRVHVRHYGTADNLKQIIRNDGPNLLGLPRPKPAEAD